MKLYQKVKTIRENQKLSQNYVAHELGLDQSQYSRREKGEVQFVSDEILKLASLLNTSISVLFDENKKIINKKTKPNENIFLVVEKLIEQYEFRLKEKDEIIRMLHEKLKMKKN